ncbi:leucine-rich repeat-containing protein 34 isoform X3 [Hyperolius riggenbachi]|uniref:leucine-rich repeat-containing protein 34 isoform X3 n=1 Tax=Hyperolius riggenbachi TaxID=752182 RepID=UPI0035A2AE99
MAVGLSQVYTAACAELNQDVNPFTEEMFLQLEKQYTTTLKLCGNNRLMPGRRITDEDFLAVSKVLRQNSFITGLDLRFNNLTDKGAVQIAKFLQEGCFLFYLNLMGNDIETDGAAHIAKALHGVQSLIAFATVLRQNTSLKSINLNRPLFYALQEDTTIHIALMLKTNNTLKELHLSKHEMTDFGVERLCEALHENTALEYLDLSCNKITRTGVKCLADLLKSNTSLQILDLTSNRTEDEGIIYLAEAIGEHNSSLKALAIVSNNITGQGLKVLASAVQANTSLAYIYIWGNVLDEDACVAFSNLLATGRLSSSSTDVQPYIVDGKVYLAELSHGIKKHYYWTPSYGIVDDPVCNSAIAITNHQTL